MFVSWRWPYAVGKLAPDLAEGDLESSLLTILLGVLGPLAHVLGELEQVRRVVELLQAQLHHRVDAVLDVLPVALDLLPVDRLRVLLPKL